ncbi:putative RNA-binding protein YlmH isoform X1 [Cucumis melo var. makuwa]|uniref:RNA-binding protein YlmH isoform X1 n=1 Tax=Cucumis melo var. makuwa TaxID=1194695 RepID=A0A5A7UZA5_CUCMM|nr:putative RNA-binding protein YlmH isoform X1 [Cucumis melo var. makuwa]
MNEKKVLTNGKGGQVGSRTCWSKERGGLDVETEPYEARVSCTVTYLKRKRTQGQTSGHLITRFGTAEEAKGFRSSLLQQRFKYRDHRPSEASLSVFLIVEAAAPAAIDHSQVCFHLAQCLLLYEVAAALRLRSNGICQLVQAVKGDIDVLLNGVGDKGVIVDVKQILVMAKRSLSRREVLHTNFLTPPVVKESMLAIQKLADVKAIAQGGYPEAERCRISVGHSDELTSDPDIISALSITGNFTFHPCSHGDFLGSILGTGIAREKLGDIIIQEETGAQVVIVPELVDFLISSLRKVVGNVTVSCTRIPLTALEYEPPKTKTFKTIEASLRVDALASAGFKISRSKLVDLISPILSLDTAFGRNPLLLTSPNYKITPYKCTIAKGGFPVNNRPCLVKLSIGLTSSIVDLPERQPFTRSCS